jgi:hypothetical protein
MVVAANLHRPGARIGDHQAHDRGSRVQLDIAVCRYDFAWDHRAGPLFIWPNKFKIQRIGS